MMKRTIPERILLLTLGAILLPATSNAGGSTNYMDPPRINIAGKFFANPSTVNNDPKHYTDEDKRPSPWQ